jgi:hypothetical protein
MTEEKRITRRGQDGRTWYVVATALGDAEAAIVAGLLKSAGIPVWAYRESAGWALGLNVGLLGTIEILTPGEYYEEAMALLEEGEVEAPQLEDGASEDGSFTVDGTASPVDEDDRTPPDGDR